MAEVIRREESVSAVIPARPGPIHAHRSAGEELLERLQARWEDLKERVRNPNATNRRGLVDELRDDADYLRARARYHHENRPLHALAIVAGAAFALGLLLGLGRD